MKIMKCGICGRQLDAQDNYCSACGTKAPAPQTENTPSPFGGDYRPDAPPVAPYGQSYYGAQEGPLVFGGGIKAWCVICIAGNVFSALLNILGGIPLFTLVNLVGAGLFGWLLLEKRRLIFYCMLGYGTLVLLLNLWANGLLGLFSLLNPLITWLILRPYWPRMR